VIVVPRTEGFLKTYGGDPINLGGTSSSRGLGRAGRPGYRPRKSRRPSRGRGGCAPTIGCGGWICWMLQRLSKALARAARWWDGQKDALDHLAVSRHLRDRSPYHGRCGKGWHRCLWCVQSQHVRQRRGCARMRRWRRVWSRCSSLALSWRKAWASSRDPPGRGRRQIESANE